VLEREELDYDRLAGVFPTVPLPAALAYDVAGEQLFTYVNRKMDARPDISKLLGQNPRDVMYENHRHHVRFMANVFKMNDARLFLKVVPWVYRSYSARGFSLEYFPLVFPLWAEAVQQCLRPDLAGPIVGFYQEMVNLHDRFIEASASPPEPPPGIEGDWEQTRAAFLAALLAGHQRRALQLSESAVSMVDEVRDFYLQVIRPSLYQIGVKWEVGEISVAHEHLATSIVSRVMAALYPRFLMLEHPRGAAVVCACPDEHHEIGPRMVADLLELDGWDVTYLGANTPAESLLGILEERRPRFLALSVTMPFNIDRAHALIELIRGRGSVVDLKVLVGGQAFSGLPEVPHRMGADAFAGDAREAVVTVKEWGAELGPRDDEPT